MFWPIEYCAGSNEENIEYLYNVVHTLLKAEVPFKDFPDYTVKPVFIDENFMNSLNRLFESVKEFQTEELDIPSLSKMRQVVDNTLPPELLALIRGK